MTWVMLGLALVSATPKFCVEELRGRRMNRQLCDAELERVSRRAPAKVPAGRVDGPRPWSAQARIIAEQLAAASIMDTPEARSFVESRAAQLPDLLETALRVEGPSLQVAFSVPQSVDTLTPVSRGAEAMMVGHLSALRASEQAIAVALGNYPDSGRLRELALRLGLARKNLALRVAALASGAEASERRARLWAVRRAVSKVFEQVHAEYESKGRTALPRPKEKFFGLDRDLVKASAREAYEKDAKDLLEEEAKLAQSMAKVLGVEAELDRLAEPAMGSGRSFIPSYESVSAWVKREQTALISFSRAGNFETRAYDYHAVMVHPAMPSPIYWTVSGGVVLDTKIRSFNALVSEKGSSKETAKLMQMGEELFEKVFGSARIYLKHRPVESLLVDVDGALHQLNFSALRVDGAWLAEKWAWSKLGTRFFDTLTDPSSSTAPVQKLDVLAVVDAMSPINKTTLSGAKDIGPLESSRRAQVTKLSDVQATAEKVHAEATKDLLHFGTHGQYFHRATNRAFEARASRTHGGGRGGRDALDMAEMRGHPEDDVLGWLDAALLLTPEDASEGATRGKLTGYEIAAFDLAKTHLVVLAACESGLGGLSYWHGTFSLERAFLAAGAGSVVASGWSVDDGSTALLMRAFYRSLLKGQGRAKALKDAMTAVREAKGKDWSHPYHWAAFSLVGETGPVLSAR